MSEKSNSRRRFLRNDLIPIVALLAIAAAGILWLFVWRDAGDTVTVTINGELYATFPLSAEVRRDIAVGEHHNCLIIRDGKAMMESADCPDGICVAHRPIFRDGESIVCLPHGVVITVTANSDENNADIII